MAHSSTSPSKKTQTVHFQATFQIEEIELVAKISRNHQHKIELSINNLQKKRRYITQEKMAGKNQAEKNQTKDLKCAIHLLSDKFRNMSEEKKAIVRDLGFGSLMHIPSLRVHHQILKELANSFKLGENRLETGYGSFKVRPKTIGAALGINASGSPHVQENFHPLYTDGVPVTNDNKQNFPCAPGTNFQDGHNNRAKLGSTYKKRAERPPELWIANWTREQLVERMRAEMEEHMTQSKKKKVIVEDSSPEQAQSYHGFEIGTEELDEILRENNEKSAAQEEKEADLRSTEGHYVSSKTLSLVVESASEPAEENMVVVREEMQSEALAIVPIQVCLPLSQTTTVPEIEQIPVTENEPTPVLQIEGTTKSTPEPPQKPEESTPTLPPAPSKINPAPEDVATLMMMARTASYVPKTDPMPSFSLGLNDSSQEEAAMQEGASAQDGERAKTHETPKLLEQLGDLVEKLQVMG
ncbi:uncharacterized protein DS421_18g610260 [Arachis hypogaea]|nr:uncharacterized protein DS421_18g610260 [Arachis hypogaea]